MEEIVMLERQELKNILKKEIFSEGPVASPGEMFQALCESFPLQRISSKQGHRIAVSVAEKVSLFLKKKELSGDQSAQMLKYLDALGVLIEDYEGGNFLKGLKSVSGSQVLKFLMEQHDLRQKDLEKEIGGQAAVSSILNGKRKLNTRQIVALSERFGVNPAVFF
jgi:HTH-type transcriptional regulator / antitoxin HigA